MKKLTIILILMAIIPHIFAQDYIYKKTGETIQASIIENSNQVVKYKLYNSRDQTIYEIHMGEINMIDFHDKGIEFFNIEIPEENNQHERVTASENINVVESAESEKIEEPEQNDLLYTSSGDIIKTEIVEITDQKVIYKDRFDNSKIVEMPLNSVDKITYKDGSTETFGNQHPTTDYQADNNDSNTNAAQTEVYYDGENETLESSKKVKGKSLIELDYSRSSVSTINLIFNNGNGDDFSQPAQDVDIPDKFFTNNLQTKNISIDDSRNNFFKIVKDKTKENILDERYVTDWLNQQKIGNQIIAYWFNRDNDGTFDISRLKERGVYNATDDDFFLASTLKRGITALEDQGLDIIKNSYVFVFDFYNLVKFSYYNKYTKETVEGYNVSVNCYLYKLEFNEKIANNFFQNMWIDKNSDINNEKLKNFENSNFNLKYETSVNFDLTSNGLDYKSLVNLANGALDNSITKFENQNENLRVKELVYSVKPIGVKIGRKESLKFDQRYFVYENRQNNKGEVYSKRKGVIKAMKVVDNRSVAKGEMEPSLFYQIAGGKIDNQGMFVEQRNSLNTNISASYKVIGMTGIDFRIEKYIGSWGYNYNQQKTNKWLRSLKMYADLRFGGSQYNDYKYSSFSVSLGFGKDFHLSRNTFISPYIGYGMESTDPKDNKPYNWDSDQLSITTDFLKGGIDIGFNLLHNVQLFANAEYGLIIYSRITTSSDSDKPLKYWNELSELGRGSSYNDVFPERAGPTAGAGIRIML